MSAPNLKKFLIENGVFDKFCKNLKNGEEHKDFKEFIKHQRINKVESDGGLFAFLWSDTPEDEGFHFWNEIDIRWQKYYYRCSRDGKL